MRDPQGHWTVSGTPAHAVRRQDLPALAYAGASLPMRAASVSPPTKLARLAATLLLVASLLPGASLVATAKTEPAYYDGKRLRFIVGSPVGGGFDTYGRFFARHLPRFIPGNPAVM